MNKAIILLLMVTSLFGQTIESETFDHLKFRNIGPSVAGGRIHDVEVVPGSPEIMFVASASGGIWKSSSKGTIWKPVSTIKRSLLLVT